MKEKLEQELINSIDIVKEYLTKGAAFAAQEAPLIIDEIVRFNLWYSGAFLLISIGMIPLTIYLMRLCSKGLKEDNDFFVIAGGISSVLTAIFGIVVFLSVLRYFIMCLTAPRLFVIEYLGKLL